MHLTVFVNFFLQKNYNAQHTEDSRHRGLRFSEMVELQMILGISFSVRCVE